MLQWDDVTRFSDVFGLTVSVYKLVTTTIGSTIVSHNY